jgi:hypothetical protein
MTTSTCNLNCICIDSDCSYKHYITYKERKIVKNFYDAISSKSKDEPNAEMRKKNCTFGQLCEKETCGFRHRLSFAIREKLIVSYRFNKIFPNTSNTTSNTKNEKSSSKKEVKSTNLFMSLEDIDDEDVEINDIPSVSLAPAFIGKSWSSVVQSIPQKVNLSIETSRWEDLDDDDFYMKF